MSGIITATVGVLVTTAVTVVLASLPDTQALLMPLTDGGNEYALVAASVLATVPLLGAMTVLAASGRE